MRRAFAALVVLLLAAAPTAHACPSCKEGLSDLERWAQGFNTSILFMMAMPFLLVAAVGGALYYQHRRRRSRRDHEETEQK